MLKTSWHFDFHSHRDVRIGMNPNPQEVADQLADAGVEEIITFAKGHCGYSYYPTDVPTCYVHPQMKGDPFGDIAKAVSDKGIRVLAYVSFGIDGEGTRHNPHWAQHTANGRMENDDWFICICPFTPYVDECVLPQVAELIERYPIQGFFFDTMSAFAACYCEYCQKAFNEAYGRDLPHPEKDAQDDPIWGVYGKFRHDRGLALIDRVTEFIQERLPGAAVGFNQIGSPPNPEKVPAGCTRLTLDFATFGHQSRQASRSAAYGSMSPVPADVMPTIFNGGWGDWSTAPFERLEQIAVPIWARNCNAYLGDRLHPDNRLAEPTKKALKQIKEIRSRIEPLLPPEDSGAELTPDVLIVLSIANQYGADYRFFAGDSFGTNSRDRLLTYDGATDLMLDAGVNYAASPEHSLATALPRVKLAMLAECEAISVETNNLLRKFVEDGGQLLIVGTLPSVDGKPIDWVGVTQEEKPWQDHIYLPPLNGEVDEPIIVRGDTYGLQLADAQAYQQAIKPLDMSHGVRFGWGISPPSEETSDKPILTNHTVGDNGGAVWVLGAPLFSSYESMGNWQQVRYAAALMRRLLPRPTAALDSPYGQVELIVHGNEKSTWAVLVNHGGEVFNGERRWPRTWGPVPTYEVVLRVRLPQGRKPTQVKLNGESTAFEVRDDQVFVPVTMEDIWRVVKIDWE